MWARAISPPAPRADLFRLANGLDATQIPSYVAWMPKTRRTVEYPGRHPSKGGNHRMWGYGYTELSRLLGVGESTLRSRVARGTAFPGDLEWVCNQHHMYVERCAEEIRRRAGV